MLQQLADLHEVAKERVREARDKCGLYWGTYNLVEAAVKQSAMSYIKPTIRKRDDGRRYVDFDPWFKRPRLRPDYDIFGNEPKRYSNPGKVGVQIQGGITASELAADTRLQIDMPTEEAWGKGIPHGIRRKAARTKMRIRVGSSGPGGRTPVWAEFPIVMNRPLPSDAKIMGAWVKRVPRNLKTEWRYELGISFESRAFHREEPSPGQIGEAAINFGWRQVDNDELRVAVVNSTTQGIREVRLPYQILRRFDKCKSLRSILDTNFDTIMKELILWIQVRLDVGKGIPEWLENVRPYLSKWNSQHKLSMLIKHWRGDRIEGDEVIFGALESWLERWEHLYMWEHCNYQKALRARTDYYKNVAFQLATTHRKIIMEKFDLRKVAKRPGIIKEEVGGQKARENRQRASISSLRLAIASAASRYCCEVQLVNPTKNTITCHICGATIKEDPAKQIVLKCLNGHEVDQDLNNTQNQHSKVDDEDSDS